MVALLVMMCGKDAGRRAAAEMPEVHRLDAGMRFHRPRRRP
jgi:hypothetical protein